MVNTKTLKTTRSVVVLWALLSILFSAEADEVVLSNGDVIHGTVTEQTDEYVALDHPNLGTFQISKHQIDSVILDSEKEAEAESPSTGEPSGTDEDGILDTSHYMLEFNRLNNWAMVMKQKGFKMSLNLALDGSWGNTDEQTFRFGYSIGRTTDAARMNSDLTYYLKNKSRETTDNKLSAGYRKDWLWANSRWFYFYQGRYDFDDFESWRHRLSGHSGPGYNLIDTNRWDLIFRGGLGARKEWESKNDNVRFEGMTGLDMKWKISERQLLAGYTEYYQVLTDFEDYRTRSGLNWRYFMSRELDLSFLLGVAHEYQNVVDPDSDKNDTRVHMGIQYDF